MANVKLLFQGTEDSQTEEHTLECFLNLQNQIFIEITGDEQNSHICLDKSTAIRFHRELKKQISFLED